MKAIRKYFDGFVRDSDKQIHFEVLSSVLIRRATIISFGPWINIRESRLRVRHSHSTYARMLYPKLYGEIKPSDRVMVRIQNLLLDNERVMWRAEILGDILP